MAKSNTSSNNTTKYLAKKPDQNGYVTYTDQENQTWHTLITRQLPVIEQRACPEFLNGLEILDLPLDQVPQLPDVNKKLFDATGWQVTAVPALINFDKFFNLLSNRQFPAATFIRVPEELDYLQEPDIFHEIFGHCPMLTNRVLADFTAEFAKLGVGAAPQIQKLLARLYWFTIEFGLIKRNNTTKIYGGGILSSIGETVYALDSNIPERKLFDVLNVLRTPYRIDIYQTTYFIIHQFEDLTNMLNNDLLNLIKQAIALGEFDPTYPPRVC
jgi:phenylalanine-4-hydroxylase